MLAETGTPHLPFLSAALRRHLQELPWTRDGLSLTERLALRSAAFRPSSERELFSAVQELDPQPFLGDAMFKAVLHRLETAPRPALTRDGLGRLTPTRQGEALLAGSGDWVEWNPPEHWVAPLTSPMTLRPGDGMKRLAQWSGDGYTVTVCVTSPPVFVHKCN